jgi:peroxiredoxin
MSLLSRRHLATVALAVAGVAAGWLALGGSLARAAAPQLSYTLLDGRQLSTADLRGQVVLINFWATTCASCVAEMPALADLHTQYHARGFDTLAVAMSYDPPAYVADFAERRKLPFGVAIDNTGAIARGFGDVQGTPTSVLIDKHGAIVRRYVGTPDFVALRSLVQELLAES